MQSTAGAGIDRLLDLFGAVAVLADGAGAAPEGFPPKSVVFQPLGAVATSRYRRLHPPDGFFGRSEPPRSGSSPLALDQDTGPVPVKASDGSITTQLSPAGSHTSFNAAVGVLRLFHSPENLPEWRRARIVRRPRRPLGELGPGKRSPARGLPSRGPRSVTSS